MWRRRRDASHVSKARPFDCAQGRLRAPVFWVVRTNSRFPSGMTERKARAKTKATARAKTKTKATARARAKTKATAGCIRTWVCEERGTLAEPWVGILWFGLDWRVLWLLSLRLLVLLVRMSGRRLLWRVWLRFAPFWRCICLRSLSWCRTSIFPRLRW